MGIPKFEPVYSQEGEQLRNQINRLIAGYNGWCDIVNIFHSDPFLRKMYERTMSEMQKDGNCGMSTCIVSVIKDLVAYAEDN